MVAQTTNAWDFPEYDEFDQFEKIHRGRDGIMPVRRANSAWRAIRRRTAIRIPEHRRPKGIPHRQA